MDESPTEYPTGSNEDADTAMKPPRSPTPDDIFDPREYPEHADILELLGTYRKSYPEFERISPIEDGKLELLDFIKASLSAEDQDLIIKEVEGFVEEFTQSNAIRVPDIPEPANLNDILLYGEDS